MKQEKIKEIKKALECCKENEDTNSCAYCFRCPFRKRSSCQFVLFQKLLTLINELESENNRILERNQILEKRIKDLENIGLNEDITVGDYLRELEKLIKENKLLLNAKVVCESVDYCYEDLKKAEKRIAELEKENGELLKENEGYNGSYRCAIDKIGELSAERYIKVEQFAERLKEKIKALDKYYSNDIIDMQYNGITVNDIDETLKEFTK